MLFYGTYGMKWMETEVILIEICHSFFENTTSQAHELAHMHHNCLQPSWKCYHLSLIKLVYWSGIIVPFFSSLPQLVLLTFKDIDKFSSHSCFRACGNHKIYHRLLYSLTMESSYLSQLESRKCRKQDINKS